MRVLGVCAGNGVTLHPFKKHLLGNFEPRATFHSRGEKQWNINFKVPIWRKEQEIPGLSKVDIIIGNPNCGHSSMLALSSAKKFSNPKDDYSLMLYLNMVNKYKPTFFFLENLPAMLKAVGKEWLENYLKKYDLTYVQDSVTYFGNSQKTRIRLVVVGIRKSKAHKKSVLVFKNNLLSKYITNNIKCTKDLLVGLKDDDISLLNVREDEKHKLSLYCGKKKGITVKKAKRLWNTRMKGSRRWVVNRPRMKNQPGVYRNLNDQPPLTATKGTTQFRPDGLPMSPRELARIQGIPDSFKLYGDMNQKQYWINKGRVTVTKSPPYEIGIWIKHILNGVF